MEFMNEKDLTIIHKTLSKYSSPDLKALQSTFKDMEVDVDMKVLEGIQELIAAEGTLDDVIEMFNSSGGITEKNIASVKQDMKQKKEQQMKDAKLQAQAFNYHAYISDYKVVGGKTRDELTERVKESMKNGWKPFGGTSASHPPIGAGGIISSPDKHFQAMVKFSYN